MKLRLYRLANLFNPSSYPSFIVLFGIIMLGSVYVGYRIDYIVGGIFVLLIYLFLYCQFNYPKYIEFIDNEIYYRYPTTLTRKRGLGFFKVNAKYHVSEITKFTLYQNKIERHLGVAHIVFEGKTTVDAGKYTNRIRSKNVHCIYGIYLKKHNSDITSFAENFTSLEK